MRRLPIIAAAAALASCGSEPAQQTVSNEALTPEPSGPPVVQQAKTEEPGATGKPRLEWERGESGAGLRLNNLDGTVRMSIACAGSKLVVNVPSFTPIGSEDRFMLALGQNPVTLVADPTRQRPGTGVTAEGPAPRNLGGLLSSGPTVGALYGTQKIEADAPPSSKLANQLASGC